METSSTSRTHNCFAYDVFLSFRGEDTRKNFVDHLYFALVQKNIRSFKDDIQIKKGRKINYELMKSIEDSKVYIIVFSKNYASSSSCLGELVKIMECYRTTHGHVVYPIFYDVKPSELRNLTGTLEEPFAKHENEKCVVKWKVALEEAAEIAGWDLQNNFDGHEAKLIQNIIDEIESDLCNLNGDGKSQQKDVFSSLKSYFGGNSFVKNARIVNTKSYEHGVIELTQIRYA